MANLKLDLLNKLNNDKYYAELELVRLAQEPNMNYRQKMEEMQYKLGEIAVLNANIGLVAQDLQDAPPAVAPAQVKTEAAPANAHPGQTFAE